MKNKKAIQGVIDDATRAKKCYKKGKLSTEEARVLWHFNNNIIRGMILVGASKKQLNTKKKDDC